MRGLLENGDRRHGEPRISIISENPKLDALQFTK